MKTPHTSAPKGKRIRVKRRDGFVITDRFVERRGKGVVLAVYGFIPGREIASFSIIR